MAYGSTLIHHLDASVVIAMYLPSDPHYKPAENYFRRNRNVEFRISKLCLGEVTKVLLENVHKLNNPKDPKTEVTLLGEIFSLMRQHISTKQFKIAEPTQKVIMHFNEIISAYSYGTNCVTDFFLLAHACADGEKITDNCITFVHANPKDFKNDFLEDYAKKFNVKLRGISY